MKRFSPLYRRAMVWSRHPHAPWYLGGISFVESSFFPIPPDVMLAPMCLANPRRAWWLALLTLGVPAYYLADRQQTFGSSICLGNVSSMF